jgi:hypothetical protein
VPYTAPTLSTFRAALASRLQDPTNVFWASAELTVYIQEALRTWNIMAAWYRDRMVFNTTSATPFYDLSAVPGSLIPYTVTDRDLFQSIEYSLLEPITNTGWAGSEQFNDTDILTAIQERRDQFLLETGCVLTHSTLFSGLPANGRVDLSPAVIEIRRLSYLDALGAYTLLWRTDENELFNWMQGWSVNPGAVSAYSVIATPPVRIQLAPIPSISGTLDLVTINSGAALTLGPVVLGIPDDLSWAVKWGALADLLTKDGPPSDPFRAAYCEQRYQQGVMLAKLTATVMFAYLDSNQVQPVSLFDLDCDPAHAANWQNDATGNPGTMAVAGMNLIALDPPPNIGPHSVMLDVLRNFPVPVADSDIVQVGQEQLDVILDYSEHLATFKMSGAEFQATQPAFDRMVRLAHMQNEQWRAFSKSPGDDTNKNRRDFSQVRREAHPELQPVASDMDGGI